LDVEPITTAQPVVHSKHYFKNAVTKKHMQLIHETQWVS